MLKVRGEDKTPLLAYTPNYTARHTLEEAMRLVRTRRVAVYTSMEQIDREFLARHRWLEAALYQARSSATAPVNQAEQVNLGPHAEIAIPASFGSADGSDVEPAHGGHSEGNAEEEQRIESAQEDIEREDDEHQLAEAEAWRASFGDDG